MCDKAVDDCLAALESVHYWFVTSKLIEKIFVALQADKKILQINEDSANVVFSCNEIGIFNIGLNKINLDDTNYVKDEPDTITIFRLLAWHIKFKVKNLKKSR